MKTVSFNKLMQWINENDKACGRIGKVKAHMNFIESGYHQSFCTGADALGYVFGPDDRPILLCKTFFASIAAYLANKRKAVENNAWSIVLRGVANEFKFAAWVILHPNKNADEPGNWSFEMTFNQSDYDEMVAKIGEESVHEFLVSNDDFKACFDKAAHDIGGIALYNEKYIYDACLLIVDAIEEAAHNLADMSDKFPASIDLPRFFDLSVDVDGDEVYIGITPSEELKTVIKNDKATESDTVKAVAMNLRG